MDEVNAQNAIIIWQNQRNYVQDALTKDNIDTWYNAANNGNIGKFYQVLQLINSGNYNDAKSLNSSINTTLQPEINQQQYNTILLNHYLRMQSIPNH